MNGQRDIMGCLRVVGGWKLERHPRVWGKQWPHWCINYHWYAFWARFTPAFRELFLINWWIFICKLRSKERFSSDHAGMKRISSEVFIFCLWTDWIYFTTFSKREFRELHYCSRSTLDKSCENDTFDRCLHRGSSQKSLLACGDAKKEN